MSDLRILASDDHGPVLHDQHRAILLEGDRVSGVRAVAVIEGATEIETPFEEWLNRLRELFNQRRNVHWKIVDCLHEGKQAGHLTQYGLDLLSEDLGEAPKPLQDALKVATAFPPSIRDETLSVEHHAVLATMPKDQALPLLAMARKDRMSVTDIREVVTMWRHETGQTLDDDDVDSTLATLIIRAWNRATPQARQDFMARATLAKFGIIDEDEVQDDDA